MKNIAFRELLTLVLIVVCFFGCGEAELDKDSEEAELDENSVNLGGATDEELDLDAILKELEELLDKEKEKGPAEDHVPPKIIESNITPNAENVGRNVRLWIKFDEPINDASVTLETVDGNEVETLLIFRTNDTEIELIKLGKGENFQLKANTIYVIKGKVSDDAGNETKVEITFTTGVGLW